MNSFYSTYEELKQDIALKNVDKLITFLQYLWGIETWKKGKCFASYIPVFTVPMRNWNRVTVITLFCFNQGFYSTYEELKPISESITDSV